MRTNGRRDKQTASLAMQRLIFPLMALLAAGQIVYIFTTFDVTGAALDLMGRLAPWAR